MRVCGKSSESFCTKRCRIILYELFITLPKRNVYLCRKNRSYYFCSNCMFNVQFVNRWWKWEGLTLWIELLGSKQELTHKKKIWTKEDFLSQTDRRKLPIYGFKSRLTTKWTVIRISNVMKLELMMLEELFCMELTLWMTFVGKCYIIHQT